MARRVGSCRALTARSNSSVSLPPTMDPDPQSNSHSPKYWLYRGETLGREAAVRQEHQGRCGEDHDGEQAGTDEGRTGGLTDLTDGNPDVGRGHDETE